jgi:ketosteroid isomerase-like protein
MNRRLRLTFLAPVLLGISCAPTANVEQERTALLDRDRAWSQTPPDADKFVAFFAADASFLPPNMPIATGTDAIRKVAAELVALPGFSVRWSATKADVGGAGDLGYTQGTYELTLNDPTGKPMRENGKYVTVWKKQAGGQWMVVADIFNPDAPPPAPAPTEPARQ